MRNRREAILAAALDAFATRGYAATSMSDLRRATEASTGSLYHHFPSKEHLVAALFLETLEDFQRGFAQTLRNATSTRDGVQAAVRYHLGWVTASPDRARLLGTGLEPQAAQLAGEDLRVLNRSFFADVRRWLDAGVQRDELHDLPADLCYALWLGPAQEVARAWLAGHPRTTPCRAADTLADGAWRALSTGRLTDAPAPAPSDADGGERPDLGRCDAPVP